MGKDKALFVRTGRYDITPAIPRFVAAFRSQFAASRVVVLSWPMNDGVATDDDTEVGLKKIFHRFSLPGKGRRDYLGVLSWLARIGAELLSGRYALVQCSDVICLAPCLLFKPILGYRLVMDIRDPIAAAAEGRWRKFRPLLSWLEEAGERLADAIVIVDENRRQYLPETIAKSEKVVVVRNLPLRDYHCDIGAVPRPAGRIVINYSGYLSERRGLRMLSRLVGTMETASLEVVGETRDAQVLKTLSSTKNIKMIGRVPHKEALRHMASSHLVALLYDPSYEANQVAAPNKFYEALMLGRACVTCNGTPMAKVVESHDCGYVIEYDNDEQLRAVCEHILADSNSLARKERNARKYYENNCQWKDEEAKVKAMYLKVLT
mgnify:CR=1 FL=1